MGVEPIHPEVSTAGNAVGVSAAAGGPVTGGRGVTGAAAVDWWPVAIAAGVVAFFGAGGTLYFLDKHKAARNLVRKSRTCRLIQTQTHLIAAKLARTSADVRWHGWLKTRITARGAELPELSWLGACARCGDLKGLPHECRDLAR